MSKKAFDYSKWDKIELSDDEDDVHPNIDRESWFRLKHRSRVEREDNQAKDIAGIQQQVIVFRCVGCNTFVRVFSLSHSLTHSTKSL